MNHLWSLRLPEVWILGKHSVYTHFPTDRNCKIFLRTKLQAPRAEDAKAKPYLVLKILVT